MKFNIDKEILFSKLQYARDISENESIDLFYSYFIFEAKNNTLYIKSSDRQATLEITIQTTKENQLDIIEEGGVLLSGNKIYTILSSFPSCILSFTQKETKVIIRPQEDSTEIEFSMYTREKDDYPKVYQPMPEPKYKINGSELLRIIVNTSFAVSSEIKSTVLFLTGIFFDFKETELIAVATDRNRLSISKMKLDSTINLQRPKTEEDEEIDLIVPSKSINIIKSIIIKENPEVYIGQKDKKIFFLLNEYLISVNIISGKYHNYESVLPENKKPNEVRSIVKVKTKDLSLALERVSSIADDKRNTNIEISIKQNKMIISKEEEEKGFGRESIDCELTGEEKTIVVKAFILIDPLKVSASEYMFIDYGMEKRSLIRIKPESDKNSMHIATPVLVSE